jgi:hypothetical protein
MSTNLLGMSNTIKTEDDVRDLAIRITDALVVAGYVPDCTDSDDQTEFDFQDIISSAIASHFNIELE